MPASGPWTDSRSSEQYTSKALRSAAMGPTGQEREIIRRIFDFDEHGTTQMFDDVMENRP